MYTLYKPGDPRQKGPCRNEPVQEIFGVVADKYDPLWFGDIVDRGSLSAVFSTEKLSQFLFKINQDNFLSHGELGLPQEYDWLGDSFGKVGDSLQSLEGVIRSFNVCMTIVHVAITASGIVDYKQPGTTNNRAASLGGKSGTGGLGRCSAGMFGLFSAYFFATTPRDMDLMTKPEALNIFLILRLIHVGLVTATLVNGVVEFNGGIIDETCNNSVRKLFENCPVFVDPVDGNVKASLIPLLQVANQERTCALIPLPFGNAPLCMLGHESGEAVIKGEYGITEERIQVLQLEIDKASSEDSEQLLLSLSALLERREQIARAYSVYCERGDQNQYAESQHDINAQFYSFDLVSTTKECKATYKDKEITCRVKILEPVPSKNPVPKG